MATIVRIANTLTEPEHSMPKSKAPTSPKTGLRFTPLDQETFWSQSLDRLADLLEAGAERQDRATLLDRVSKYLLVPLFFLTSAQYVSAQDFVELPRDLEVELALSALPDELQDRAAVYVRDPDQGFVLHREGTNGWMTFVARTSVRFYAADWDYSYPSDMLIPQAHGELGLQNHVRPYFDLERLRIAGTPPAEAKRVLRERFENGTYRAPARGGVSYMLAPMHRAYMAPAESDEIMTVSFPHHMPYAPFVKPEELGPMDPYGRSGILDHGGDDAGPHGYLYLMIQPDQVAEIQSKYAGLLGRLCEQHDAWCLPEAGR